MFETKVGGNEGAVDAQATLEKLLGQNDNQDHSKR
jgi:hypothetical protein